MKKILYYTMHMNKKVLTPTQGLQKIVENVFVELNMLEKSAAIVRHRNFHGSFFLNNPNTIPSSPKLNTMKLNISQLIL